MRKFDTRRQLDGESVAEYEHALRTLYREAWPRSDEVTRDAAMKRKFEEGLGSGEMLQFLRLYARQDDFGQTVAKARRFAETQEAVKPKKAVRILEAPERDHNAESIQVGTTSFQPLLDGFKEVIQTVLQDRTQPTVGNADIKDKSSKGGGRDPRNPARRYDRASSPASSNGSQRSDGKGYQQQRPAGSGNRPYNHSPGPNQNYGERRPGYGRSPSPSPGRNYQNRPNNGEVEGGEEREKEGRAEASRIYASRCCVVRSLSYFRHCTTASP